MPTISTLTVDVESRTSKFSAGLKIATAGLAALAAGAAYAFGQFEESEKIASQTDAVLKSTGNSAHITAQKVSELAEALAEKSGIDDEAIQTGENMILTFKNIQNQAGKGNDIFNQTTAAVLDMSVAMGQDMRSSAIQVGKALNDPIAGMSALMRVGVQFTEQQKEQITGLVEHGKLLEAQKIVLGELTSEFGGSAEAQATASGKMKVALGNLAETVGGLLAPAFNALAKTLNDVIGFLQDNAGPAFQAVMDWLQGVWDAIKPVAEILARDFMNSMRSAWAAIQNNLLPAVKNLWQALEPILKIVGAVIAVVLDLGIRAIPFIIKAIALWYEAIATIIKAWETVVSWIKDKLVEPVVNAIGRIIDWVGNLIEKIKGPLIDAWRFIAGPIGAVFDKIIGWIQDVVGWIQTLIGWLQKIGSQDFSGILSGAPGQLGPRFNGATAAGGIVTSPQLRLVGEAGPEAIIPLSQASGIGGITGDIVLQIDGQTFARISRDQLIKMKGSRGGSLGLA